MTPTISPCMDFTLPSNMERPASLPAGFQLFAQALCFLIGCGTAAGFIVVTSVQVPPAQLALADAPHLALCALVRYISWSSLAGSHHKHLVDTEIWALLHTLEPTASDPRLYPLLSEFVRVMFIIYFALYILFNLSLPSHARFTNISKNTDKQIDDPRGPFDPLFQNPFFGINFDMAVQECTSEQLFILREATRMSEKYLQLAAQENGFSDAWHRYFLWVNPGSGNGRDWQSGGNLDVYANIRNSLFLASTFPTQGNPRRGKGTNLWKLTYRCKEDHNTGNARRCSNTPNPGAYTSAPDVTSEGYHITFCPKFFTYRYLNDITAGKPTHVASELISFEHMLAHEYMHCKTIGHAMNIVDIKSDRLPSVQGKKWPVYGKDYTHELAWLYVVDDPRSYRTKSTVNPTTALNADNYVWYANSVWFREYWGFNPTKRKRDSPSLQGRQDTEDFSELVDGGSTSVDANDQSLRDELGSLEYPVNCRLPRIENPWGPIDCDYIGEYYSDYAASATAYAPGAPDMPTPTIPIAAGMTAAATAPNSTPTCSPPGDATTQDAQIINEYLDTLTDQKKCCGGGNGCKNVANSEDVNLDLCGDVEQCIGCARLANYVAGLVAACTVDGKVSGSQDINEAPGLSVAL